MKITLIRHPAPAIAPGICYGRLDIGLSPEGESHIGTLTSHSTLPGATRVWTSPSRRCHQPASAIAQTLDIPLSADPRLMELHFGDWEGQAWDSIARELFDRWAASPHHIAPPNGETCNAMIERVTQFHAMLHANAEDCIVVSHGGALKILIALLQDQEIDLFKKAPAIGSIQTIQVVPMRAA